MHVAELEVIIVQQNAPHILRKSRDTHQGKFSSPSIRSCFTQSVKGVFSHLKDHLGFNRCKHTIMLSFYAVQRSSGRPATAITLWSTMQRTYTDLYSCHFSWYPCHYLHEEKKQLFFCRGMCTEMWLYLWP